MSGIPAFKENGVTWHVVARHEDDKVVLFAAQTGLGPIELVFPLDDARSIASGMLRARDDILCARRRDRARAWLAGLGLLALVALAGSCGEQGPRECIEGDKGLVVCEQGRPGEARAR